MTMYKRDDTRPPCNQGNPRTDQEDASAVDTHKYTLIGWTMGVVMGLITAVVLVGGVTPDFTSVSFLVPLEVISFIAAMMLVS